MLPRAGTGTALSGKPGAEFHFSLALLLWAFISFSAVPNEGEGTEIDGNDFARP